MNYGFSSWVFKPISLEELCHHCFKKMTLLSIAFLMLFLSGCEVCAKCIEQTTQQPDEFCGKKASVDIYVKTLEATPGTDWKCTID
jgi:hypothetical protein